jgi:hypothetical protein
MNEAAKTSGFNAIESEWEFLSYDSIIGCRNPNMVSVEERLECVSWLIRLFLIVGPESSHVEPASEIDTAETRHARKNTMAF